jgi:hypothetical protein
VEREIKANFKDMTVEIVDGRKGTFDVEVENVLIYSRKKLKWCSGRFPKDGEITELIKDKFFRNGES